MAIPPPVPGRPAVTRRVRADWILLGGITLVCLALLLLQWRWTGEFARAERVRLRAVLAGLAQRMAQTFDENLRSNCLALLPLNAEPQADAERAHL